MPGPVFRPRRSLLMASALSAVLLVATAIGWLALPPDIQVQFTGVQLATLLFFVLVMVVFMMSVGLSYVRVDTDALVLRNGVVTQRIAWAEIRGFRFTENDPWAYVLLTGEPEQRALLGIQRTDRERAEADFDALNAAWRQLRSER